MQTTIFYGIDAVIVFGLLLLATASLLKKGYNNHINRLFTIFSVLLGIFIITNDISGETGFPKSVAHIANYVTFSTAFAATILIMQFVMTLVSYPRLEMIIKRSLIPLWIMCALSATSLVTADVMVQDGEYAVIYGPLVWLYTAGIFYMIGIITWVVIYGLHNSSGVKKRQLIVTGIGLLLSVPAVVMLSLVIPLITGQSWYTFFGTAPFLVLVVSLYYGVIRYHLFDIRAAAVRTLAYVLSLAVLAGIYYVMATILSDLFFNDNNRVNQNPLSIGLALGLLFIFQPVKTFFDRLTSRIFYRDYYDSDEFFARVNRLLISTTELRTLLERVASEIASTLKSEQAFFFVNVHDGRYVMAGTENHRQLPKNDAWQLHTAYESKQKNGVMVVSLLAEDDPIRRLLASHGIELVLPLVHEGVVGYLCLGEHRISHYTTRDTKVLTTIADELVIAIHNTLSIEEVRSTNVQLRQLDKAKDEFISIASHELRTPMTVIRGFISLIQREQVGSINDRQKAILEKVNINTVTLINLVNDMLDLAKLDSGKLEINLVDKPIEDLVNGSIEKMRLLYSSKGLTLEYRGAPVVVRTDPEKFERVMLNLLSNAYKFTLTGGQVLITSSVDDKNGLITICVADTGIGIGAQSLKGLFKKFSQVDNYLQRQTSGSGLGLAICKQLVERLGGKIWASSQPGVGSEFYFTIPIADQIISPSN